MVKIYWIHGKDVPIHHLSKHVWSYQHTKKRCVAVFQDALQICVKFPEYFKLVQERDIPITQETIHKTFIHKKWYLRASLCPPKELYLLSQLL